jgi:uncharacterized protein (DUF952 family)
MSFFSVSPDYVLASVEQSDLSDAIRHCITFALTSHHYPPLRLAAIVHAIQIASFVHFSSKSFM